MYRAYRFRLYPTTNQVELIHKTFGCTRVVCNHYLEKQKTLYDEGKDSLSCFDMIKDLKRRIIKLPKLKEVSIKGYRDLEYLPRRIINATIEQASTLKYYVSVLVEEDDVYI